LNAAKVPAPPAEPITGTAAVTTEATVTAYGTSSEVTVADVRTALERAATLETVPRELLRALSRSAELIEEREHPKTYSLKAEPGSVTITGAPARLSHTRHDRAEERKECVVSASANAVVHTADELESTIGDLRSEIKVLRELPKGSVMELARYMVNEVMFRVADEDLDEAAAEHKRMVFCLATGFDLTLDAFQKVVERRRQNKRALEMGQRAGNLAEAVHEALESAGFPNWERSTVVDLYRRKR
jgi:hypothetical protein